MQFVGVEDIIKQHEEDHGSGGLLDSVTMCYFGYFVLILLNIYIYSMLVVVFISFWSRVDMSDLLM